jgi:acyl transferase domain-containing protein
LVIVEAGALSYELGLQFAVARAKILAADPDCPAGMAAIAASEPTILQSIQNLHISDRVVIAVFSGMNNHVVSGELGAVNVLVEHFKKIGVRATLLNVDQGGLQRKSG